jgi:hypothetical protein
MNCNLHPACLFCFSTKPIEKRREKEWPTSVDVITPDPEPRCRMAGIANRTATPSPRQPASDP